MEHLKIIQSTCKKVFDVKEEAISIDSRLMGGMSNFTYIIKVNEDRYTFRVPGKNAEQFVDRDIEKYHIELIESLNLNNDTIYLDVETGYKIAKYIEGQPLHELNAYDYLDEAAEVLRKIHQSSLKSNYDYAPFDRLEKYENLVKSYDHNHHERYIEYKNTLLSHKDFLDQQETTLTHGDSQISNFVVTNNELKLMDWEFTGNNDPFYDIACFGNANFDHAIAILPVYLKRTPQPDDFNRLYLWRTFQCLQWHNVALYKEFIGLSQDLHIDFKKVAGLYLDKAEALLAKLK
ncbi:MAG: phosphotransferase [Candidatus Izemoplasmataceae bacterium]